VRVRERIISGKMMMNKRWKRKENQGQDLKIRIDRIESIEDHN
jgi:hypothetical protein